MNEWHNLTTKTPFSGEVQRTPITRTQLSQLYFVSTENPNLTIGDIVADTTDTIGAKYKIISTPQLTGDRWASEIIVQTEVFFVMYKLTDWAGRLVQGSTSQTAATGGSAASIVLAKLKEKYSPVDIDYVTT